MSQGVQENTSILSRSWSRPHAGIFPPLVKVQTQYSSPVNGGQAGGSGQGDLREGGLRQGGRHQEQGQEEGGRDADPADLVSKFMHF